MASHRAPDGERSYKTFGWQGINLTVPSTWNLVFVQGNYQAGNVRLADETSLRLEVRWQAGRESQSLVETLDAYIAKLGKRTRKEGAALSVQRDLKLASPVHKEVECYRWVAQRQGLAMLSRCTGCGRLVHLNMLGRREEPLKKLARTVFASLNDHAEGQWLLWRFFDVEFRSPEWLALGKASLQAGCVRMNFSRRLTRLEFVRVSLAQILLAGNDLTRWFTQFYGKSLRRRSFELQTARVKGHPGLEVHGRPWRLVNPLGFVGRRRMLQAACWHCEETNRLFICCLDGPEKEAETFQMALQSVKCCEAA